MRFSGDSFLSEIEDLATAVERLKTRLFLHYMSCVTDGLSHPTNLDGYRVVGSCLSSLGTMSLETAAYIFSRNARDFDNELPCLQSSLPRISLEFSASYACHFHVHATGVTRLCDS